MGAGQEPLAGGARRAHAAPDPEVWREVVAFRDVARASERLGLAGPAERGAGVHARAGNGQDRVDFVVTADESCMHNYELSFMAGFLACVPVEVLPPRVKRYMEHHFFNTAPHRDGRAELAILALRKVEAYLAGLGYEVAVAPPQEALRFEPRAWLLSTMDPIGIGPASTTMIGLAGGRKPFNNYFFERLVGRIRERSAAPIVVGGPGAWEFDVFPEARGALGIDTVFDGAVESAPREFWEAVLRGEAPGKNPKNVRELRPDPRPIRGPSFWGMVEISRGCGRGCQFCDFELMSGFKWLPKEFILNEARLNAASPYVNTITLLSEDTLRYGTRVGEWRPNGKIIELCAELVKLGKPLNFTHCCLATALASPHVTQEFSRVVGLSEKRLAGFQTGIESGSPKIIARYMKGKLKPWQPEDWPEVVEQGMAVMVDNYIVPHATLVMGLPEETPDDTVKTLELVDRLRHIPSLILPLFFVPLSVVKGRPLLVEMLTPEQKELLVTCSRHTAGWGKRLPNWCGALGLLDKLVFVGGARYCFDYMETLRTGRTWGKGQMVIALMKSAVLGLLDYALHREPHLDYWQRAPRNYPVLARIPEAPQRLPLAFVDAEGEPLGAGCADKPPGSGCGCGLGGAANIAAGSRLRP